MRIDKLKHYENDSPINYLYVIDIIHGHATLRKKRRHIYSHQPGTDFIHFFIIEDFSLLKKSRDEKKVAAAEQSNFYWERRLGLFWKLYKESMRKLLVSLVHQFLWPSFTLVFTRNVIFRYSQKPWMRLTFRTEAVVQCPGVFCKKGVLRNFAKSTGKCLCQTLFFNKVAGLSPATLFKKRLAHSCEFCEISKNPFFHRAPMVAASGR